MFCVQTLHERHVLQQGVSDTRRNMSDELVVHCVGQYGFDGYIMMSPIAGMAYGATATLRVGIIVRWWDCSVALWMAFAVFTGWGTSRGARSCGVRVRTHITANLPTKILDFRGFDSGII